MPAPAAAGAFSKEYHLNWLVSPREASYIRGEKEEKEDAWQR